MKKKKWILLSCLLYALGIAAILYFYLARPQDFFSSPAESRDLFGFKDESSLGILKKKSWAIDDSPPASSVMAKPTVIPGADSEIVLNWDGEVIEAEVPQTENWSTSGVIGDASIDLVAFATWHPQPDDDVSENADWDSALSFYDAKTLEPIATSQLDEMGIPDSYRSIKPLKSYRTPKIRLLFKASNTEVFRVINGDGGDAQTEAIVTYDIEDLIDDEVVSEKIGEWARYDMALLTWHDIPVNFQLQFLTGTPQRLDLKQETGEQVAFGDLQRIQWITSVDGNVSRQYNNLESFVPAADVNKALVEKLFTDPSPEEETTDAAPEESADTEVDQSALPVWELPELENMSDPTALPGTVPAPVTIAADPFAIASLGFDSGGYGSSRPEVDTALWLSITQPEDSDWEPITLVRIASPEYMKHLGWIREDGSIEWRWSSQYDQEGIEVYSTRSTKNLSKDLQLVFLPKIAEIKFKIDGLPGVPNPRETEDLFDVVIPRITLPENPESAEDRLLQLVSVITQNGWDIENLWDDNPPSQLPEDRTFRNTTPQELLDWYLKVTPKAYIQYDEAEHVLTFNEEKPGFLEQIKTWFTEKTSGLFQ